MKIRIKGNSLRYRLTKSDVAAIMQNGCLEERTEFGERALIYALRTNNDTGLTAEFKENRITLFVPRKLIVQLADTDEVGFEHTQGKLHLLIEKDFTCLDQVTEDQSDNYPNPLAMKTK